MTQKEMMQAMMEQMNAMAARIEQLEKGAHKGAPKPEKDQVQFVKKDGTVRMCSQAQADNWARARKEAEERKATYPDRRKAFTDAAVPKALEDAIRKNRAAVTAKEARKLGFVGTREDLKALKRQILGVER